MLLTAILVIVLTYLFWFLVVIGPRKLHCGLQFNGAWSVPLFGNLLMYLFVKAEDLLPMTSAFIEKFGLTYRVWAGSRLVIITSDPKFFEIILSNQRNLTKNNMYDFLINWLGTGLLISTGQKWFNRRKILTPAFHFQILQQFVDVFNKQNKTFVEKIAKKANGDGFDVYNDVTLMSLDIISQTAMGVEINAQSNKNSEYVTAVKEIVNIITKRMITFWRRNDFIFSLTPDKKRHDKCLKIVHGFTRDIVNKRRLAKANDVGDINKGKPNNDDDVGLKKRKALLDVLLESTVDGRPLTNAEIAEEVDTFMFEGHDTVTSALCFALYLLSQHPKEQQKVFDEVTAIIGDKNDMPTYKQLQEMKYVEWCIKETLRLFPPVPMYGRYLDEDLNLDGKIVPAKSNVNLMVFHANRNPDFFPQPDDFIPERFSDEKSENHFNYVPFSAGPRNCIGQKFAMLELKCAISNVVRNFILVPGKVKPQLLMQLTLKSSTGIQLGFESRK